MICPNGCGKIEDCGRTVKGEYGIVTRNYWCNNCHSNVDVTKFKESGEPETVEDD